MLPPFHYNESGSGAVLKVVPIDGGALVNGEAQTKLAGKIDLIHFMHCPPFFMYYT